MGKLVKAIIAIVGGVVMIPAVFVGGLMLVATLAGLLASPKVTIVILLILTVIVLPGILIGYKIKKAITDD